LTIHNRAAAGFVQIDKPWETGNAVRCFLKNHAGNVVAAAGMKAFLAAK